MKAACVGEAERLVLLARVDRFAASGARVDRFAASGAQVEAGAAALVMD